MKEKKTMIKLTLTEEQARIVSTACEFFARIKMGQFNEIIWHTMDFETGSDDYCERRDKAQELLFEARQYLFPELHGIGHSYGIGKFDDADMAFDVYQVIRPFLGDKRTPFSFHDLPKCIKCEEED